MTDIQALLTALREKGWTHAAIADEVEVNQHTVYKWQKGIQAPSNVGAVRKTLQQLLRRKRIPKKKRYARKRTPHSPQD
jgi:transposase-like protein